MDTSRAAAWMADFAASVTEHAGELTELDRQIGDADHGSNLDRGMRAVAELDSADFEDAASYLKKAGMTLVGTVGGASGPLYGTFLLRYAGAVQPGDETPETLLACWQAGLDGVRMRGKAGVGDKTMVDALVPAVEAIQDAGGTAAECLQQAATAAAGGRDATVAMVARKGRASYLGERSAGVADPGAASITLLVESAARTLA